MFSVNRNVCDRDQQAPQGHYLRAARYNIASQLAVCSQKKSKHRQWWRGRLAHWARGTNCFFLSHSTNSGGILTGREDWVRQRTYIYLSTSSSPPHYRTLLPNVVLLPTGPTLPPDCFSKVKPTQSRQIKGFFEERFWWRVHVLWYSRLWIADNC